MTGGRREGEGLAELLDDPPSRRVVGRVEVEDPTPVVVDDDEAVQDVPRRRRDREEVHACDGGFVVAEESDPSLYDIGVGMALAEPPHVAGDGDLGNHEAELLKLAADPRGTSPIVASHPANEIAEF